MHGRPEVRLKETGSIYRKLGLQNIDFILLIIMIVLVAFGITMVFSASYYYSISTTDNPFSYLIKEIIAVIVGAACFIAGLELDYRNYNNKTFVIVILAIAVLLLILVLTPAGTTVNGASRWIDIKVTTLMPGEICKPALILFVAWFLGDNVRKVKSLVYGILPIAFVTLICAALIYKQPNLSTMITVCGIVVAMLLVAGMKWRWFFVIFILGVIGIACLIIFKHDSYQVTRILTFLDPFADEQGDGYQVVQSLLALGSGGPFGVGLGKSVQKTLYLPEPQNDFILAIICEELGFIGILALMAVYCIFIWRGAKIALRAKDQFGMLLASGIVLMVAIQVLLNVAVVTSSMPATGINLPFISYGGNALMIFMFCTGVLLNISKHDIKSKENGEE